MTANSRPSVQQWTPRRVIRELVRGGKPGDEAVIASITQGLLASALDELRSAGFSDEEIVNVVGFSLRTFQRARAGGGRLGLAVGDRVARLARILNDADRCIGDRARALHWLRSESWALGGRTPLALLPTEPGAEMVRQALATIAHGGVA